MTLAHGATQIAAPVAKQLHVRNHGDNMIAIATILELF
jgi:hypothetical protein